MKIVSHLAFFRSVLLLPFVVPLFAFGLVLAGVPNILVLSWAALGYGGIPYVIFIVLAWRWMRGKTRRQISVFGLLAPVLFIPFQVIFMLSLYALRDTPLGRWFGGFHFRDCFEISYFVILFGYGYAFLAFFLWGCLEYFTLGKFRLTE